MKLYKYEKIVCLEDSIVKKLRKGKITSARFLILRYNMLLNRLRSSGPTDIPLYKIKSFTNIADNSYMLDYDLECGFCGNETGRFSSSKSFTEQVRNIRICEDPTCNLKANRYLYFKNGWIVPETRQKGILKRLSGTISDLSASISNIF
ncbi:hypothetical protein GF371_01790 [Candidatus Woesearchaeota archaeon]|nr:hypothetical protein [Candidatus Woesearchaeota archaeon]